MLTNCVAKIFTSSTSPFRNRSRANVGDRPGLGEARRVPVGELGGQLPVGAGDELRRLRAGGDEHGRRRVELRGHAEQVAVERAAQALVRADQDDRALADGAHFQQRMREVTGARRRVPLDAVQQVREGPRRSAACCALRIFDAATICIALVICAVLLTDLMRRRMSRGLGISHHFVFISRSA